jgi:hypothetical protein
MAIKSSDISALYCHFDCIVIGAGISGLQCVKHLVTKYGVEVSKILVLEAQDYVGGRVKQTTDFISNVKVELGAEILHGTDTALTRFALEQGEPIDPIYCWAQGDGGPLEEPVNGCYGLYYIGGSHNGSGRLLRYDDNDTEFVRLNHTLSSLKALDERQFADSVSLYDYLRLMHFEEDMILMANNGFANTLCTSVKDLSLKQSVRWMKLWDEEGEEEGDFKFQNSYGCLVSYLKSGANILLNSPVRQVQQLFSLTSSEAVGVLVTTNDNRKFLSRTCVLSISPYALKSAYLTIEPPLPQVKLEALECVHMHPAMKVFVKFSALCWPPSVQGVLRIACNIHSIIYALNDTKV